MLIITFWNFIILCFFPTTSFVYAAVFVFLENTLIYVFGYHMLKKSKMRVLLFC
jgi:hypothetical protein